MNSIIDLKKLNKSNAKPENDHIRRSRTKFNLLNKIIRKNINWALGIVRAFRTDVPVERLYLTTDVPPERLYRSF
ncbi:hypothetical protein H6G81_02530 [Scytonema hofmannii FACHB-248]|uniref:Transposase n=1 Tax=Scytonema hofmannii FACHB-248 TaxID=1842502 RepID=A0ABR8GJT6_9CYAN|nr:MULTISPECIES: hypothetical protein [Nostocales]MBD2603434.1 hypothetical protein [Scytonema hofmannii FACHB-248]